MSKIQSKRISEDNEMYKLIKIIVIVALIFGAFYALTVWINKKDNSNVSNNTRETIQYTTILVGNIFKQSGNYYVLVQDYDDDNIPAYSTYISTYALAKNAKPFYYAVLYDSLNQKFKGNESHITTDLNSLKFSKTTLLEVANGGILNVYEKDEDILNKLKDLVKGN